MCVESSAERGNVLVSSVVSSLPVSLQRCVTASWRVELSESFRLKFVCFNCYKVYENLFNFRMFTKLEATKNLALLANKQSTNTPNKGGFVSVALSVSVCCLVWLSHCLQCC